MKRTPSNTWLTKKEDVFDTELADLVTEINELEMDDLLSVSIGDLSLSAYESEVQPAVESGLRLTQDLNLTSSRVVKAHYAQALSALSELAEKLLAYDPTTARSNTGVSPAVTYWNQNRGLLTAFWSDASEAISLTLAVSDQPLSNANSQAVAILDELKAQKEEGTTTLAALRDAAAVTGASKYSGLFTTRSTKYMEEAKKWLIAAGAAVVALATVLAVVYNTSAPDADAGAEVITQYVLLRLLTISIPTFALLFFLRSYSTARHNAVVFENKAYALQTFEAFSQGAANDPATQHAVLIEAARSIFGHQTTGHLKNDSPDSPSSSLLLEVLRTGNTSKT